MKKRILLIWLLCFIIAYFQCVPDFVFCNILYPLSVNTVYAATPKPATPTPKPTPKSTPKPATPTPKPTPKPATPTPKPTPTPSPKPTATPTPKPTATPTPIPAPVISITSPSSGTYKVGDSITVKATGSNCDHMAGYVGSNYLGAQKGNSYSATFIFTTTGSYTIRVDGRNTANATDPGSLATSSTGATLNVADDVATLSVYVNAGSTKYTSSGTIYRTNLPDSPTSFSAGYTITGDTIKSIVVKKGITTYSSTVDISTSDKEGTYTITATSNKGMTDTMTINVSFANFNSSANIKYTQTGVMIRSVDGNSISPTFFATVGGGNTFVDTAAINNLIQSKGKIANNPHLLNGSGYIKAYSQDNSKAEQSYDLYGYTASQLGGINSYASWSASTKSAFESLASLSYSYSGLMKGTITQYITDDKGVNLSGSPTDSFVYFDPGAIYAVPISAPNLSPSYTFYRSVITDLNNASIANSSNSRTLTFSASVSHVYVRFEFSANVTPTPTPTSTVTPKPTVTPTATPVPATPTPSPSPTPIPTPIPIPVGSIRFSPDSCSWRNTDLNVNVYIQGDPVSGNINVTGSSQNASSSVASNGTGMVTVTKEGIGKLHGELHSGLADYTGDSGQYLIDKSAPGITYDWSNRDRLDSGSTNVFIYLPDNKVKATFSDNLSGITESRYLWNTSASFPNVSSMNNLGLTTPDGTGGSVNAEIPVHDSMKRLKGWYLHIFIKDRAGNEAQSTQLVYIESTLQNLIINDIKDPIWKSIFRNVDSSYNGAFYPVSLMPVDNHPNYLNAVPKKGYSFSFSLTSKGMNEQPDYIRITPKFYYMKDLSGTSMQEIDLYYNTESEYYIKIGSSRDKSIITYNGVSIGGFSGLNLTSLQRTIVDSKSATWAGSYYISLKSIAVIKEVTSPEKTANQLKNGYIVVQFQIEAYKSGLLMFQYTSQQYTNEGGPKKVFYHAGDVIVFNNSKSALDDYDIGTDR